MGACEIQYWVNPITDKHPILELTFSKSLHMTVRLACITYQRQTSQEQEEQSFPGEEICHSVGHEAQGSH